MSWGRRWKKQRAAVRLLGKVPDVEVAKKTGRTYRAVQAKRKRLGIPASREWHAYTAGEDELIGSSVSPPRVAELLGLRIDQVKGRRRRLRRLRGGDG